MMSVVSSQRQNASAMIKIQGSTETRPAAAAKKKSGASAAFKTDVPASASASTGAAPGAPASVLSALIALQSDGGGNAKTFAAAQRTLDLLDGLRLAVLEGEESADALEALSDAASARAHAAADENLKNIYDEIALRARVELAKRGR